MSSILLLRLLAILPAILLTSQSSLWSQEPTGSIRGRVIDAETKEPLAGATITLLNTKLGAVANNNGEFSITNIPAGSYSLRISYVGYQPLSETDVIVRPERITFINPEMNSSRSRQEIQVRAGYFRGNGTEDISAVKMNAEEIRRAPGSAGDISRVLTALPSVARNSDTDNDLAVRGGSPSENAFYVDNIPVPNINYFPQQGASGGPIGILNVDFIKDVAFSAGGFSPVYGDRISSVIDISYRDGNRDHFEGQLDMNMAGFGGSLEGPLPGGVGSWMVSAKRSYLDLILGLINQDGAPRFGDVQGKASIDLDESNRVTVLGIAALSQFDRTLEDAQESGYTYGGLEVVQSTIGANWRSLWGGNGYSNTSISYSSTSSNENFNSVTRHIPTYRNDYLEGALAFRNVNYFRLADDLNLEFGVEGSHELVDYDMFILGDTSSAGEITPTVSFQQKLDAQKGAAFAVGSWSPVEMVTAKLGVRADYYSINGNLDISPRFSLAVKLTDQLTANGAIGLYSQSLPILLLSQHTENGDLPDPVATHYILGLDYLLSEDTKLTVEAYNKEYRNLPIDPENPHRSVIDDAGGDNEFDIYAPLQSIGIANTKGVELLLQKKLAEDFYGMVSASYFRSRYRDGLGVWHDRRYDNQYLMTLIGGWKPSNEWEFSVRFNIAGGTPYTPLDLAASAAANENRFDSTRFLSARYPTYHSLNVRADRRFNFTGSNLVLYISVLNAYNRKNVTNYYWNKAKKEADTQYQLGIVPVLGVEWEF